MLTSLVRVGRNGEIRSLPPRRSKRSSKTFAANESAFAKAREAYTYHQTAKIQEFDDSGIPGGKWELVSDIIFEQNGRRTERDRARPDDDAAADFSVSGR